MTDSLASAVRALDIATQIVPDAGIVILTGAGISKESGLDTFRDPDGIWAKHSIEEVATPQAFARDPALVHRFYNARRRMLHEPTIQPNAAHQALVRLEREWAGPFLLVTQNVDNLHDRAGSDRLLHMHGELARLLCNACGHRMDWADDLDVSVPCPACGETGTLRPDVVWFGEMPHGLDTIERALEGCGLFLSIGTSGNVYPAAGFVAMASQLGAWCVELNLEPTGGTGQFDEAHHGPATIIVPGYVEALLSRARAD